MERKRLETKHPVNINWSALPTEILGMKSSLKTSPYPNPNPNPDPDPDPNYPRQKSYFARC